MEENENKENSRELLKSASVHLSKWILKHILEKSKPWMNFFILFRILSKQKFHEIQSTYHWTICLVDRKEYEMVMNFLLFHKNSEIRKQKYRLINGLM